MLLSGGNYAGVFVRVSSKPEHETIVDHQIATPPPITIAGVSNTLC